MISLFHKMLLCGPGRNQRLLCFFHKQRCAFSSDSSSQPVKVDLKSALDPGQVGNRIRVGGFVKAHRNQKDVTFLDLDDGLGVGGRRLQVLLNADLAQKAKHAKYHASVMVEGVLAKSTHPAQEVELVADNIEVINATNAGYPFGPRKKYPAEVIRKHLHYRLKLNHYAALIRVRSALAVAVHDFFLRKEFVNIQTPVLTCNDCEGGGEVFTCITEQELAAKRQSNSEPVDKETPSHTAFFPSPVYLTVSGQLHLEVACNGLAKVYNFSPAFRAERTDRKSHLTEFTMIEAEVAFMDTLSELLDLMEGLMRTCIGSVVDSHLPDLELYTKLTGEGNLKALDKILVQNKFEVMTYQEAIAILEKKRKKFQTTPTPGVSLSREHELFLTEIHCNGRPVFITEWPRQIKPFYARQSSENPELCDAVDLLLPHVGELMGGSLREHRLGKLEEQLSPAEQESLKWYLDLRANGCSHSGGFGLGFDRLVQLALGINNIKDSLPFPRATHYCPL